MNLGNVLTMAVLFIIAAMVPVAAAKQGSIVGILVGLVISLPALAVLAVKLRHLVDEEWKE